MFARRLLAWLVPALLVSGTVGTGSAVKATPSPAALWSNITVQGQTTSWKLTLENIRKMLAVPRTTWAGYHTTLWTMWVLTLRMTDTGRHSANIYDDLDLALKIMPKFQTYPTPGWTSLQNKQPFTAIYEGAARDFGGALPWQATAPGRTTTYCYVIAAKRGESHYGLYNIFPTTGTTFILDTGY